MELQEYNWLLRKRSHFGQNQSNVRSLRRVDYIREMRVHPSHDGSLLKSTNRPFLPHAIDQMYPLTQFGSAFIISWVLEIHHYGFLY